MEDKGSPGGIVTIAEKFNFKAFFGKFKKKILMTLKRINEVSEYEGVI